MFHRKPNLLYVFCLILQDRTIASLILSTDIYIYTYKIVHHPLRIHTHVYHTTHYTHTNSTPPITHTHSTPPITHTYSKQPIMHTHIMTHIITQTHHTQGHSKVKYLKLFIIKQKIIH